MSSGRPKLQAQRADLVLEQVAERLDQLEGQILGQSAHVVVQLDRGGRAVGRAAALDHVGIERALGEEPGAFDLRRLVGKTLDERMADPPPLLLRLDHAGQRGQKLVFRLDDVQIGLEVVGELADDRLLFVLAQQAVIDQDAGELRADGLGQQRGDHRRIDPARQPADHAIVAHAAADRLDRLAGEIAQLPRARATADGLEEVAEDLRALRRVRHLGMKLQAVDRQPPVLHRGDRAGVGGGQRQEIGRRLRHLIAVAHPDVDLVGNAGEQFVRLA